MKLSWVNGTSTILMELPSGKTLEWPCNVWARAGKDVNSSIFEVINKYWASQPGTRLKQFEKIYTEIHGCFDMDIDAHVINQDMKVLVDKLLNMFEWRKFRAWCLLHGEMFLENGIKDSYDEKDKAGLTYFTEDYHDLMVFSVVMKSMMPVWGLYHQELTGAIGKHYIHMSAVNLIRTPYVESLPPFIKLESYINCFASERVKKAGYSLISGVGTEELPSYLTSLAFIKKIVIYNVRSRDHSIVTNVYHLLNERCQDVSKQKPNQKQQTDEKGADISISDQYKIIQKIPPSLSVMVEQYSADPVKLALAVDPLVDIKLVRKYEKLLDRNLDLSEFHIPLCACIFKLVCEAKSIRLIDYFTTTRVIITTAAVMESWGYPEIAGLIVTQPKKRDIFTLSVSQTAGRSFSHLRPDMSAELGVLYPHISLNTNPAIVLIDTIIKEVSKSEWPNQHENFSDLRNSIASLIIKVGGKINDTQDGINESTDGVCTAPTRAVLPTV